MNMKKLLLISMMLMTVLAMAACEDSGDEPFTPEHPELSGPSGGEDENESEVPDVSSLQVNIMVSNRTITATMEDNAATQDFLARLPLEVTIILQKKSSIPLRLWQLKVLRVAVLLLPVI